MPHRQRLYSTLQVINDKICRDTGEDTLIHQDGKLTRSGKVAAAAILNYAQSVVEAPAMQAETHAFLLNLVVENNLHAEVQVE